MSSPCARSTLQRARLRAARSASSVVVAATALAGGCGDRSSSAKPPPAPPSTVVSIDAGVTPGVTTLPTYDPAGGFHVDADVDTPPRAPGRAGRDRRTVQIILRSTPSGAIAAVDGSNLGPTPALWEGTADGGAHDFTFRLAGYGLARYRFVPVTGGVVHGTLTRIPDDKSLPEVEATPSTSPRPPSRPPVPPPPPVDVGSAEQPSLDAAAVSPTGPTDAAGLPVDAP